MTLSKKHSAFVDEYMRLFNGTKAYLRIYPHSSSKSARANAARLIATDNIAQAIEERLKELHMGAEEVLKLLADMARGDMGEFLDVSGMGFNLDLQDAKARGLTKLIRKVKQKTTTYLAKKESEEDREVNELEIELYDAQAALEKIGRHLDLFPNKLDVTSAGEKIGTNDTDTRAEILGKLDSIATALGSAGVVKQLDDPAIGNSET
jgi:phage terminase small subunit